MAAIIKVTVHVFCMWKLQEPHLVCTIYGTTLRCYTVDILEVIHASAVSQLDLSECACDIQTCSKNFHYFLMEWSTIGDSLVDTTSVVPLSSHYQLVLDLQGLLSDQLCLATGEKWMQKTVSLFVYCCCSHLGCLVV